MIFTLILLFNILNKTPMLKELIDLVKGSAQEPVVNNPAIPNEYNNQVIAEASNTVASGLRNMVAGGGLQSLLALFMNNRSDRKNLLSNPIVSMMMGHFAGKLINNFNLDSTQANNLSGTLIPFSIEKLLASLTGGKSNEISGQSQSGQDGIGDLLQQFNKGNADGSGGLMDIIKNLAGGAQQQQQRNGGGGLMDLINGYLK
jgi:hypothetical protein